MQNILNNKKKNIALYTAITDQYDRLYQPKFISTKFNYICFTDNKIKNPGIWKIKPLININSDPIRKARYQKIFPNKLLPEYDYSVWIDSNIIVKSNKLEKIILKLIKNKYEIASNIHPERKCIYQEAVACINLKKDNPEIILKEINYLKHHSYPKINGLFETGIIFRKHNDKKIINIMEDWWWMIENFSRRDQLSFNYVLWKNKQKCYPILIDNFRNMVNDFIYKNHNTKVVSTIYIDSGDGFNNNDLIQKIAVITNSKYQISFNLSEYTIINKIIFNPLKNQFCQFKINQIKIDKKILDLSKIKHESNGTLLDNGYIDFSKTSDPQIVININNKINKLKIVGNINFYNTENLYIDSTNQINNLVQEKEQIKLDSTNQINNLVQEKEQIKLDSTNQINILKKQLQNINKLLERKNIIKESINTEEQKILEITQQLDKIRSAKAFKLWRLYCKIYGK